MTPIHLLSMKYLRYNTSSFHINFIKEKINNLRVIELQAILRELNLPHSGTKAILQHRIISSFQEMISKHQKGEIEEIILKKAFDSVKGAYISRCNGNKQSPQTRTNIKVNIKLPPPEPPVMQQNFEEFSNSDHYPLPPHFVEGYLNFIHNFYFKQIFNWKYQLNNYII